MQPSLRHVRPTDNKALAAMIRQVFDEHQAPTEGTVYSDPTTDSLFELFRPDKAVLWVAEEKGKIMGCCGIYPTQGLPEGYVELVKFYLPAEARGQGIGRALMEQCVASAKAYGYKMIYLETMPHFGKAVDLYERLGYRTLDTPLGNSGHTACDIWMVRAVE